MILPCCHVHAEVAKNTYHMFLLKPDSEFYNFLIDNDIKYDLDKYEFDEIVRLLPRVT